MSEELKPCPCGKQARFMQCAFGRWMVHCGGDEDCFSLSGEYVSREAAASAWNHRQEAKPLTEIELRDIIEKEEREREANREYYSMILPSVQFADAIHAAMPPDQSARIAELESFIETCTVSDQECQSRIDLAVGEALKRNDQSDRIKELEHERDTAVFKLETVEHQRDKLQSQREELRAALEEMTDGGDNVCGFENPCTCRYCRYRSLIASIKAGQS